ncbi:MAG: MFS transporter [Candidatus Hydrogenedentota bacterium]
MFKPHYRLFAAAFLFDFAMVCGLTASPFYIFNVLHGQAAMSGIVTGTQWALYALVSLVSAQYVGRLANGLIMALIGGSGFAILFPMAVIIPNAYFYAVFTTIGMMCPALFWPAAQSWIGAEPDPKTRTKRLAVYNVSWTLGLTCAPFATWFLSPINYRLPFLATFVAAGGAVALVASLPHESRMMAADAAETRAQNTDHTKRSEAHLFTAWFSLLLGSILFTAVTAVFSYRMEQLVEAGALFLVKSADGIQLSAEPVVYFSGLAIILNGGRAGASLVMGRTHAWQHRFWVLLVFQAAAAAAFWVFSFTTSLAVMAICCAVVGTATGVCFFASQAYSVVDPVKKHQRVAIHEGMVGLGCLLGAIGFGLLAHWRGTPWPFAHTPYFVALGLLFEAVLLRIGYYAVRRRLLAKQTP